MLDHRNFTKITPTDVDWPVIYEVVSLCGKSHNPRSFGIDILENIQRICPFNQGLVYLIDANHKLIGHYLKNIEEHYNRAYLEYYVDADDRCYDAFAALRENPSQPTINVHNWGEEGPREFIRNFINVRGLKHSVGFALFDLNANVRMVVSLDRTQSRPFTNQELYSLQLAVTLFNDMFKNFFYSGSKISDIVETDWENVNLTAREIEVVDLLAEGISPANISKILYISQSTTYKHIAHIYEKMGVSSQQELLVKLLRSSKSK